MTIFLVFMSSDVDEEITTLASFDTELIVKATVSCLEIIKPGTGLNPVLPANMAARFRMGAALAQSCSVRTCIISLSKFFFVFHHN